MKVRAWDEHSSGSGSQGTEYHGARGGREGMRPKCMCVHECVSVCKCIWACPGAGGGRVRSLKGKGVLGAEKEVSIHMVLQGILITLGWEALLTNGALFPRGGGRAPSAGL